MLGFPVECRQTGVGRLVLVFVDVLLENAEVEDEDHSDEDVVDGDEGLREGGEGGEGRLDHEEEQDEGHDQVLPAVVHEEVGETIVEPASMVQHQSVQEPELPH